MKLIVIIMSISMLFGSEPFKGYIDLENYYYIYAEGQYKDGMMHGEWNFYQESDKKNKIATGSYIDGNKEIVSRSGIPESGRDGLWIHYYPDRYHHHKTMSNPVKAKQYWSNGKMNGKFTSYFRDGKVAVESSYKSGKQHGTRKEWYMGGFMYTKPFRETEFKDGKPIGDTIYNLKSNLFLTSSYTDSSRIDSIYEYKGKNLFIVSESKNGLLHGAHTLFHSNGEIWQEGRMKNGLPDGTWKEFSDNGTLVSQIRYNEGVAEINEDEKQIIRDSNGEILYSYSYKDGKRNGESIELLHNVPNIVHHPELNKTPRRNACRFSGSAYDNYTDQNSIKRKLYDKKYRFNMQYNREYKNYAMQLNRFQIYQYRVNWSQFNGISLYNQTKNMMPNIKLIGKGTYKDNIRIDKWTWTDMLSDKVVLKGQYNQEGKPIGTWEESDPKDENNLIITSYSDEGKLISVSKRTITYSNN